MLRSSLNRTVPVLAVILSAVLLCAGAKAQTPFKSAHAKCSLTVPQGWKTLSAAQAETLKVDKSVTNVQYLAAFCKNLKNGEPELPYVVLALQPLNMRGLNADNIDERYETEMRTSVFGGQQAGDPEYFESIGAGDAEVIAYPITLVDKNNRDLTGVVYSFITRHGLVHLTCYERSDRFEKSSPDFVKLVETFDISPGAEFVPDSTTRTYSSGRYYRRGGTYGVGGLVVLIAGIALRRWAAS